MKELPRDMTRILRHGTNKRRREPYINIDRIDGSVLLTEMLDYPTIRRDNATDTDLMTIATEIPEGDKLRIGIFYDSSRQGRRIRALNGHTFPLGDSSLPPVISNPSFYLHGASASDAKLISLSGLKCMRRNDIHMVEYLHTKRQQAYLNNPDRKHVILTVDGMAASQAGIQFRKLPNGIIFSRGTGGTIPLFNPLGLGDE